MAVLDIDSPVLDAFGDDDVAGLEQLVAWFTRTTYVPVPA
jgi:GAF domain-containing protein